LEKKMAKSYITAATTTQVYTGKLKSVTITVNTALTGTVTVIDGTSGTTGNVAVITNPTVVTSYEYWDFETGLRLVTSATCDITVNYSGQSGRH
jgi:hypothetical protein